MQQRECPNIRPEYVFLVLSILFGSLFVLSVPPFQVVDEYEHFNYAYAISDGTLTGFSHHIPYSIQAMYDETKSQPFNYQQKIYYSHILHYINSDLSLDHQYPVSYLTTSKYNPLLYLPQVIGILIGKFLVLDPFDFFYFGRFFSLAVWISICFLSIKLIPTQKWSLLLLLLTPMSLNVAGSYSADSFTNSIAILWITVCAYYAARNDGFLNKNDIVIIAIVILFLSLIKPPYYPIILLYFIIPRKLFGDVYAYRKTTIILLLLSLIPLTFSLLYLKNDGSMVTAWPGVNFSGQINYILQNPLSPIIVILRSVKHQWQFYYDTFIGLLGWWDTKPPEFIFILYPFMLIFTFIVDQNKNVYYKIYQKIFTCTIGIGVVFILFLSLYITWTPVGSNMVRDFVGRYLVPISPLLLLLFVNKKVFFPEKLKAYIVIGFILMVLSITVRTIIIRYYFL
jgi:uncharacterized membrane protein